MAAGGGLKFSVGQDVMLTGKQAQVAADTGLAVAGTVTGIESGPDGTRTYAVRFPGETRHGLAAGVLEKTESPAVRPLGGGGPFSIKEAEELLIGTSAGNRADRQRDAALWRGLGTTHAALLVGLADACGMEIYDLMKALGASRRERKLSAGKGTGPAAVAASDIPQTPLIGTGPAEADQAPAPPVPAQRRGGRRP